MTRKQLTAKTSFYKTEHERMLKSCIDKVYNDEIGGNENAMWDGNEYTAWTEENLINYIVEYFMTKKYLELEDSWEVLEGKHIRFMGKQRVHEIVEHRVKYRHEKEGKWKWEK